MQSSALEEDQFEMKRLRVIMFSVSLGFVAALLAGCATRGSLEEYNRDREAVFYWGRATYLANNGVGPGGTPELWCKDANDKSLKPERRRMAAALLFGGWVQPGFTTEKMRAAIPDPHWLDECRLEAAEGAGGNWPFSYDLGSHFSLRLFPDKNEPHGWTIYFTLPPRARGGPRPVHEAAAFIRGTHTDKNLRIKEFTIFYPFPGGCPDCEVGGTIEEAHGPKGIGIRIIPVGWIGGE
ncbi:MAG TPA: hypothetical protein VN887_10670 [Candidatus Angelobacter sp.]|nr:hypothetical protein [Candidatus Angelobacter sp.]